MSSPEINLSTSKKISELDSLVLTDISSLRNYKIPAEFNNKNFAVLVSELISLITKNDIGLENVDNTSDVNKPLSDQVKEALYNKSNVGHGHSKSDIVGLENTLLTFLSKNEQVPLENLASIIEALATKSDTLHNHDISTLIGYSDLVLGINNSLNARPLKTTVESMIRDAIPNNIVLELTPGW